MSSFLLLWKCLACLVHLTWVVCEMEDKWLYSCCFVGLASGISSEQLIPFLCCSYLDFSLYISLTARWCIHTVVLSHCLEKLLFCQRSDFHKIDNLLIAVHTLSWHSSTSFSVDKILLPSYVNWSIKFRGLLLKVEIAPFCLKHLNSVLLSHWGWPLQLLAPGFAVGIQLGQVYL